MFTTCVRLVPNCDCLATLFSSATKLGGLKERNASSLEQQSVNSVGCTTKKRGFVAIVTTKPTE